MLNDNEIISGLEKKNGKGVVVGIIDSGVDLNNTKLMDHCIAGGTVFGYENNVQFIPGEYADTIGHGTAVTNIILKKASEVNFFIVKVFNEALMCSSEQLSLAIKKCVEFGCHVINISAGLINPEPELMKVTQDAAQHSYLVCACSNQKGIKFYPASYSWCFGVASGNCRKKFDYYYNEDEEIEFIARGDQQRLTWLSGIQVFMGGASFAAAHVSAIISLLLEEEMGMSKDTLKDRLRLFSLPESPQVVYIINDNSNSPYIISERDKNSLKEDFFLPLMYKLNKVAIKGKRASFFGKIKEYLNYEIVDISEEITLDLEVKYDAIIIADDDKNIDKQLSLEMQAVKLGKRVYYFTPNLFRREKRKCLLIKNYNLVREPIIEHDVLLKLVEKYPYVERHSVRCPVAGFLTADDSCDAHTSFAKLCFALRRRGYKIAVFDGTADSLLYGGDMSFPCNSQSKIETDFSNYVPSIRLIMQIGDIAENYDLIMVYNAGCLHRNGDVNATTRFIAFLIGALLEGFFYFGKPGKRELLLIEKITKAPLIQQIEEPFQSNDEIQKSMDFLVNFFK